MQSLDRISKARACIEIAVEMSRWVWCTNLAAVIIGISKGYFEIVALAAATTLLSIIAAALGRKSSKLLARQERSQQLSVTSHKQCVQPEHAELRRSIRL